MAEPERARDLLVGTAVADHAGDLQLALAEQAEIGARITASLTKLMAPVVLISSGLAGVLASPALSGQRDPHPQVECRPKPEGSPGQLSGLGRPVDVAERVRRVAGTDQQRGVIDGDGGQQRVQRPPVREHHPALQVGQGIFMLAKLVLGPAEPPQGVEVHRHLRVGQLVEQSRRLSQQRRRPLRAAALDVGGTE